MNNLDLKSTAEDLIDTFLKAGKIAKEISQKGVKIVIKADKSPVTNGDLAVDKLLQTKIKSLTPSIPIISEETVNFDIKNEDRTFWLIDPIDGTKDYIKKKDEYTLNAALIIDLKPALGMVYAPEKDRLFYSYGKNLAFEINNGKKVILNCKKKHTSGIIGLESSGSSSNEVLEIYKKSEPQGTTHKGNDKKNKPNHEKRTTRIQTCRTSSRPSDNQLASQRISTMWKLCEYYVNTMPKWPR